MNEKKEANSTTNEANIPALYMNGQNKTLYRWMCLCVFMTYFTKCLEGLCENIPHNANTITSKSTSIYYLAVVDGQRQLRAFAHLKTIQTDICRKRSSIRFVSTNYMHSFRRRCIVKCKVWTKPVFPGPLIDVKKDCIPWNVMCVCVCAFAWLFVFNCRSSNWWSIISWLTDSNLHCASFAHSSRKRGKKTMQTDIFARYGNGVE